MKKDIVDVNNIPTKRFIFDRTEETVLVELALISYLKKSNDYYKQTNDEYWSDKSDEINFILEQIKA